MDSLELRKQLCHSTLADACSNPATSMNVQKTSKSIQFDEVIIVILKKEKHTNIASW